MNLTLTLWHWKKTLVNAQDGPEKTGCCQKSLAKNMLSNG